jgi:nucleotide-binding universal stress UspA family protein
VSSEQGSGDGRIVVGVDSSDSSKAALAWAVRQAALTGATVDVVAAWQVPAIFGFTYTMTPDTSELDRGVHRALAEAVTAAAKLAPEVEIRPLIVQDNPAAALLDAAKGADLLVVGSRGHGGFTEALLGSVGQHCVHHAKCPVVVVRSDSR